MKTARISVMVGAAALALSASLASAQLNSTAQTIALNANLAESLTVTLSANAVNFSLSAGSASNPGSVGVTATTNWTLGAGRTSVALYAYFTNAAAALTDGAGHNIPSSAFYIADNAGTPAALTSSVLGNTGTLLSTVAISNTNRTGSHADNLTFNIDLTSLGQLPAATYTGTLNIQAQATT